MTKILTVDDSITLRESLRYTLETEGYDIIQGENGQQGLELMQNNSDINLIITDINMPVMNGIEFLQNIRKINKEIPVAVLTTESEKDLMEQAKTYKANAWIIKPFSQEDILEVVKKLIK